MILLFSLFFGAGVAAFIYSKMARRTGSGNEKSLFTIVGVVFVLVTIVFYTVLLTLGIK